MSPSRDLISLIDALEPARWNGLAYRHVAKSRSATSAAGSKMFGGRWNPRDLFGAIYLASSAESAAEEFRRMAAGQGRGPRSFLPRDLHTIRVAELQALDLRDDSVLLALDITADLLSTEDWSLCQQIAEAAHFLGYQAIIAKSASGVGDVIAVFDDRIRLSDLEVLGTQELSDFLGPDETIGE